MDDGRDSGGGERSLLFWNAGKPLDYVEVRDHVSKHDEHGTRPGDAAGGNEARSFEDWLRDWRRSIGICELGPDCADLAVPHEVAQSLGAHFEVGATLRDDPDVALDPEALDARVRANTDLGVSSIPELVHALPGEDGLGGLFVLLDDVSGGCALERAGRASCAEVLRWLEDLLEGLARLHDGELTWGSLSPGDVFVSEDGRASFADLGLALAQAGTTARALPHCRFAAPELTSKRRRSTAADVYSLAAAMHFLATGKVPKMPARGPTETARGPGAGLPPPLGPLLQRLGAKKPTKRPSAPAALDLLRGSRIDPGDGVGDVETTGAAVDVALAVGSGDGFEGVAPGASVERGRMVKVLVRPTCRCHALLLVAALDRDGVVREVDGFGALGHPRKGLRIEQGRWTSFPDGQALREEHPEQTSAWLISLLVTARDTAPPLWRDGVAAGVTLDPGARPSEQPGSRIAGADAASLDLGDGTKTLRLSGGETWMWQTRLLFR